MENKEIINKYKEKIANSSEFKFLNAVQQVALGWSETPDVLVNIQNKDKEVLIGNKEIFIEAFNQLRAINMIRQEQISNSANIMLSEEDLKVSAVEAFLKRREFTKEETEMAYNSYMKSVLINKNNLNEGELFEDNQRIKEEVAQRKKIKIKR